MEQELQNSIHYLQETVGRTSGFKRPLSYFENQEETLFTLASQHQTIPKTEFQVPDLYFENLENTILKKIESPKKKGKLMFLKTKHVRWSSLTAACFLLLITIYTQLNSEIVSMDDLSVTEIESWLDRNLQYLPDVYEGVDDFDETDLLGSNLDAISLEEYLEKSEVFTLIDEKK